MELYYIFIIWRWLLTIRLEKIRFDIIYLIIVTILGLNTVFEFCFKYHFYTEIRWLYLALSIAFVRSYFKNKEKATNHLDLKLSWILYIITTIICSYKLKISLIPLILIPFMNIIEGNIHKIKTMLFILVNCIYVILFCLIFFYSDYTTNVTDFAISSDGKYAAVVEETDLGATGGHTNVYVGRNINLGILGYYCPRKLKYYGNSGETPEILFLRDRDISDQIIKVEFFKKYKIMINNIEMDINSNEYIDDYN